MVKKPVNKKQSSFVIPGMIVAVLVVGIIATIYGLSSPTRIDSEAASPKTSPPGKAKMSAQAQIQDATGKRLGTVRFTQARTGVTVRIDVKGLTPGFHGFHIHEVGACVAPFTTAGGHWSLTAGAVQPNHSGDLPVLFAQADGSAHEAFTTDRFSVTDLFDSNGSAVIIHAGPDNFANIPKDRYQPPADETTLKTGDAGARAACGMIEHTSRPLPGASGASGQSGPYGMSGPTGSSGYYLQPGSSAAAGPEDEDPEFD